MLLKNHPSQCRIIAGTMVLAHIDPQVSHAPCVVFICSQRTWPGCFGTDLQDPSA